MQSVRILYRLHEIIKTKNKKRILLQGRAHVCTVLDRTVVRVVLYIHNYDGSYLLHRHAEIQVCYITAGYGNRWTKRNLIAIVMLDTVFQ